VGIGGDFIMAIDGRTADRPDAITRALAGKKPGDKLNLTLYRSGRQMNLTVTLTEAPDEAY
jgi:S1-C subfamily serine protease